MAQFLGVPWKPARRKPGAGSQGEESTAVYLSPETIAAEVIRSHPAVNGDVGAARLARVDEYDTFRVLRIDLPTPPDEKQKKSFRPIHSVVRSDGVTIWKKGYPLGLRPLFRRAELDASPDTSMVVVCGGEKAASAAAAMGLVATTCAGGERAIDQTDWRPLARFSLVVVCIDNDPTGKSYGESVCTVAKKINPAAATKVLLLPGLPAKGDIVEWIAAGGTRDQFLRLVAEAPEWTPPRTGATED